MRTNPLLKWLLIALAALVVFISLRACSDPHERAPHPEAVSPLTTEEMKALGIEGDTPRDTVATLVAQVKQLRNELKTSLSENKDQQAENDRLRAREGAIDQRIQGALETERSRLQQEREQFAHDRQQAQGLLSDIQRKLDNLGGDNRAPPDLPVGLGLDEDRLRWVEPEDRKTTTPGTTQKSLSVSDPAPSSLVMAQPAYTVPANATLVGSIAMTALIGRVPIDGTVNDPYPFKVLVGPDNLTANGIELPEVAGMVMSGTASGDWTLSCVRGQIRSVTFVFQDGTIRTVPEEGKHQTSDSRTGLGWISDPHGIPCVPGVARSNARQYLGSQALITAAGAAAASLIQSDNGSVAVVSTQNGSLGTVGISGNEAMGRILAGGVREMADWVNKLYGQAFAAIVVPPGAPVAVHLDQALHIDYDPHGRRVNHAWGEHPARELD